MKDALKEAELDGKTLGQAAYDAEQVLSRNELLPSEMKADLEKAIQILKRASNSMLTSVAKIEHELKTNPNGLRDMAIENALWVLAEGSDEDRETMFKLLGKK